MMTSEVRKKLIANLVDEHKRGDELLRLPWQDAARNCEVIKVPLI